ncbi:MAG: ferritin family protein [Candidatus Brocadiia bacterium]
MRDALREAVQKARKLEIDGADFYTTLASMCATEAGQRMFKSFAADERRHLRVVKDLAEGVGVDVDQMPMPRDEIRTLFTEAAEQTDEQGAVTSDEKDAVQQAMEMETESYNLYVKAAEDAADEDTRRLFERLSREENQHYEMLENTLEYLNENAAWFLWKEWALIVGDQSSLGMG